jgi:MarR family transcriptional regulator, organic hydroperoxide resistance regulator
VVYNDPAAPPVLLALQRAAHASAHALTAGLAGHELAHRDPTGRGPTGHDLTSRDLTGSEVNALANLAGRDGQAVSELAAACGARPTTLTSVLDRLERRGHVTRGRRPGDRRAVLVQLTPAGRRAADAVAAAIADLERRALAALPPEAIAACHAVLHALTEVTTHDQA